MELSIFNMVNICMAWNLEEWGTNQRKEGLKNETIMTAILVLLGDLDKMELQIIKNDITLKLDKL